MSTTVSQQGRNSLTHYDQVTEKTDKKTGESSVTSSTDRNGTNKEAGTKTNDSSQVTDNTATTEATDKSNSTRKRTGTTKSGQASSSQQNSKTHSLGLTTGTGTENRKSQTVRELTSKSVRTGGTNQKANIGCVISFSIPILGRVPTNGKPSCPP